MTQANSQDDRNGKRVERALQIINAEPTEEALKSRLEEVSGNKELARLSLGLFARREEIGSFRDISDLKSVEGLPDNGVAALIDGLNLPTFEFETETLQLVHWVHGSELVIERPEAVGPIERHKQGIRISSLRLGEPPYPQPPGQSWARMSIPAPSFAQGQQFYVKSVLFNFESFSQPFGPMGRPIATPYDIEVWDGHVRIATERIGPLPDSSNRYLRVPIESSQRVRYGLSVSFLLFVMPVPEEADHNFWIDIGAVGVELVTRTGMVVAALP